jgi:predicted  nucleic acid-binding Zn-ribbon protein
MLSREDVEQMINQRIEQMIHQRIEPLTEEIATLKAQLGKVDLLAIDTRHIRQSPGRLETTQNSQQLDFERQEKRLIRFEKQTNDQLTDIKEDITTMKADITTMKADITTIDGKVVGLQTEMHQRFTTVETQLTEHKTLLTEILARLPKPE